MRKHNPYRHRLFFGCGLLLLMSLAFSGCWDRPASMGYIVDSSPKLPELLVGVETRTLANGLTVVVRPDHRAPVAAVVTHVKTGYFHEPDELAGISHVLEHMFFNGTPRRPGPEDISRETKAYGGSLNAGTIYDRTSYHVVLPSERWREGMDIQADALQNPLFDEAVLANELEAILQEARRKLDNPVAFGREKMFELTFEKHRMRRWRIGVEDVLRSLDAQKLRDWHSDHYRPSNVVLSVVGDVDPSAVFAEAERLYGSMPAGNFRQRSGPGEGPQDGFRYTREYGDLGRNYVFVGFQAPGVGHPDNAALEVLATILGAGNSSRLHRTMVEKNRSSSSVGANSFQFEDIGIFTVETIVKEDQLDRANRDIFSEIERVRLMGVDPLEVKLALGMIEADEAFGMEEALGQAGTLAHYEALGGLHLLDREMIQLRAVTPKAVQDVAMRYLDLSKANLLEYVGPKVSSSRSKADQEGHLRSAVLASTRSMELDPPVEAGFPYLDPADLERLGSQIVLQREARPGTQRFALPGGAVLLVRENAGVPTASSSIHFRGGRIQEIAEEAGITRLMQRAMSKRTLNRSTEQMAFELAALGTTIGRLSSDDHFGFALQSLDRDMVTAFDLLFDVVANPDFEKRQMLRERDAAISAIHAMEDQSAQLALQFMRRYMFGAHPYGFPALGSMEYLNYIELDRMEEHFGLVVRPETMVISVAGNVDADRVNELASLSLNQLTGSSDMVAPGTAKEFYESVAWPDPALVEEGREFRIDRDRAQSSVLLAWPTVPAWSPDRHALAILKAATGGLGGRFFEEIRGRRGLAYQVSSLHQTMALHGWWGGYVACAPDSAEVVSELLDGLVRGLATDPPSQDELERAQNYLAGLYQVGLQTNRAQAGRVAILEIHGRALEDYDTYTASIRAISREDLRLVAERYFADKPNVRITVGGNPALSPTP